MAHPRASKARDERARLSPARRGAILTAARTLFLRYGFRRTSMDLLATEAQVAKPTLYAYFADKNDVFRAVVDELMSGITQEATERAAREGALETRFADVLVAKYGTLYALLHTSPHASELLAFQTELQRGSREPHDASIRRLLTSLVQEGVGTGELDVSRAGMNVQGVVESLLMLGHGAACGNPSPAAHRRHLRSLVRLALAGLARR